MCCLSNNSDRAVVLLQVLWRFGFPDGRDVVGACAWAGDENLLLPFGLTSELRRVINYRSAILPESKRYITNTETLFGNNSDVRPPFVDEIWKGGEVNGFGRGYLEPTHFTRLSIGIEGAFFEDGEFAGANRTKLFEQITGKIVCAFHAGQHSKDCQSVPTLEHLQTDYRWVRDLLEPDPRVCSHMHYANGAPTFRVFGAICEKWVQLGADRAFGPPASGEAATAKGCVSRFAGGKAIYWGGNTGAHELHGLIARETAPAWACPPAMKSIPSQVPSITLKEA